MKWNDVELVDGKFYFVEVERWEDGGRICDDSQIEWIKRASRNYVSIWNRKFNDNIELV